jgi:hypothetical protein
MSGRDEGWASMLRNCHLHPAMCAHTFDQLLSFPVVGLSVHLNCKAIV